MLSENIIADLIRFDECAKCFQKENRDKLIAHLDFSLPFLCLNSYFFVYPYQERSTKAFLLLCGRLFYPLEDEWTMVFELSLIRSAFNGWAVAAGAVGGGVVGGLVGWGVGAAITAVGAAATGSAATAAAPVVQQVAEKASTALQTYYPPNDGFSVAVQKITLEAGTLIQRTGDLVGRYIAPAGTPTQMLSLPYDKIGQPTTILQVQQSVEVLAGRVAPWFGQIGGGIQYQLGTPLDQLISEGIIKIFGG